MVSIPQTTAEKPIFDQLCEAITHEQGATDASLKTAHVLAWDVGPNVLVGLEAGGERVTFRIDGDEKFAAAFPFDENGVHDAEAELLGRGAGVKEGLADVEYKWVRPEYQSEK